MQISLGANYRKLWTASAISNLGDGVRLTALPLFVASLTREPAKVAAVELAGTLPWFLFALTAGAVVDRVDKKRAMTIANVIRAGLMIGLAAATLAGSEGLVLLYGISFLLGSAETIFDNAAQSIMPAVVRRDQLERANSRLYAAEIINNQFAGGPLGGLLFAAGAALPFIVDGASFAVSALLIAALTGSFHSERSPDSRTTIRHDIATGLRWLWRHRLIRTLALMLGVWNGINMAGYSILVLYALEILDLDELGFGILAAAAAGGGLVGTLVASRISRRRPGTTLIGMVLLGAVTALVIAVTSNVFVVGAMLALEGFAGLVWNVITVSLRQRIVPDDLLGRVNSVYRLLGWGSMPIGAAIGGITADAFGLRAPFLLGFGVLVVTALAALPIVNDRTIAEAQASAGE